MVTKINPSMLQYRDATIEDAPTLQQLIQSSFRASDTRSNWTGDTTKFLNDSFSISIDILESAIRNENSRFMIATKPSESSADELASDIVACFNIMKKSEDLASIAWFTVATPYQQFGLGRHILARAERYAKEVWPDLQKMELNALSSRDALIAWYERNGYVRTGKIVAFPTDNMNEEDQKRLQGVVFVYMEKRLE